MLPNPSHLEAANPFAAGRVRAEQQRYSSRLKWYRYFSFIKRFLITNKDFKMEITVPEVLRIE